jgi:hypothetical protein
MVHSRLGNVYVDLGRVEEGLDHLRQALAIAEALAAIDAVSREELANVLSLLGDAEIRAGRLAPGCEHAQRALRENASLQAGRSVTPQLEAVLVMERSDLEQPAALWSRRSRLRGGHSGAGDHAQRRRSCLTFSCPWRDRHGMVQRGGSPCLSG